MQNLSMYLQCFLCAAGAASLSWLFVGLLVREAPRFGLVDNPNERSSHSRITPRGGGIGIVLVWVVGTAGWWLVDQSRLSLGTVVIYMLMALSIAGISLRDDFRSVGAGVRLMVHLGAAAGIIAAFGSFELCEFGVQFRLGGACWVFTMVWLVGLTNVFNFMDGIDGIAGLQGVLTGIAWAIAGMITGTPFVSVTGSLLLGGCLGFLIYNWSPAKIFMGDVGSAFLGLCFGMLPLLALHQMPPTNPLGSRILLFSLLTVWPFVADGSFTFCRRLLKREPVWKPHRSHLYQRLVLAGWSHEKVATYYGLWAAVCGLSAVFFLLTGYPIVVVPAMLSAGLIWLLTVHAEAKKALTAVTPPGRHV